MSGRDVKKGTTDVSTIIRIVDSTNGTPETGVTSATSGLDLKYRREGAATVDLTESNLSALTDAHSDGGMLHIGAGYYRVDVPDAAFATGAPGVLIFGTVTDMVVIGTYHMLTDYDPYDAVRMGLTALPNAAADAAGGLPISDAGGLDLDNNVANALAAINLDHLFKVAIANGDVTNNSAWAKLLSKSATAAITDYDNTTDSLQAVRDELAALLTTAMTESYGTDGSTFTVAQALYMIWSRLVEFSTSGTTITCLKLDGSTTAFTLTLSDATNPTGVNRTG